MLFIYVYSIEVNESLLAYAFLNNLIALRAMVLFKYLTAF